MPSPEIGNKAPNFSAPINSDTKIKLSDYKGSYLILYFYPKDDTPGCTKQAIAFTEHLAAFSKRNAKILGVSRDTIAKHEKFKDKHGLAIDLISDEDEKVCTAYDVIKMKNMYGKQVRGIERSTFLIDPNGKIVHIWRKVKVDQHIDAVLAKLDELT